MSVIAPVRGPRWIALAVASVAACGGGSGNQSRPDARPAAFRDADIYDTADASIVQIPDCPASCDDQNPCTSDSCDTDTHLCRNDPAADGTTCVTTDLCSLAAVCKAGFCVGTTSKDCTLPPDQCHESGYCVPTTGLCSYPNSVDHKGCDDGNLCTTGDQCMSGVCQAAPIQCGAGATCDPKTGQCPGFPTPIWGIALDPIAATAVAYAPFSDVTVSTIGAVYFTASFANTLDLGAGSMSTTSTAKSSQSSFDYNAVIARLDPSNGKAVWSKSLGDKADQAGSSIAANANDIVLVSGFYNGRIDFGPVQGFDAGILSFSNTGSFPKVFLVAVDGNSGALVWASSIDLSANNGVTGTHTKVAVDYHDGNFVLCATPSKLVTDLGATHVGGQGDVLIAKLDSLTGRALWVQQFGSAADESCDAVTTDNSGRAYITGHLSQGSSLDLGGGIVLAGPTGKNQQAAYVAQLDSGNGTVLWGKAFYSQETLTGKITPSAIVTDGSSVWVGGSFTYSAAFGQVVLPSVANSANPDAGTSQFKTGTAFVAALDATSGTALWAENWGANAQVGALAHTSTGNLILGGDYVSGMVFDTGKLADSAGGPVPFVAKLVASTGRALAARGYASSSTTTSWLQAIAVDSAGSSSQRDVSYAVGVMGDVSAGVDLGEPVGRLPPQVSIVDGGMASSSSTLFLAKFSP
jgi:hypothetical protein